MTITAQSKAGVIGEYALNQGDTGSPEVQVALLTDRIKDLTEHFKIHIHDYLKGKNEERYRSLIGRLGLRR